MKNVSVLASVVMILSLVSCSSNTEKKEVTAEPVLVETITPESDLAKGFQKLQTVCFSCHSPNANATGKVAPTMAEIKAAYSLQTETEEDFSSLFTQFVSDPNSDKSLLKGAAAQYGMMPKFEFSEEELSQVAKYVYATPLDTEDWYNTSFENELQKYKSDNSKMSYVELGKKFALSTKSVLGKNLKGAIKNKGTANAVSFCNERAIMLTDSMSDQLHVNIVRVSDQPRNENNLANQNQLEYITKGKEALLQGQKIKPLVQEQDGQMVAYYPIVTNQMCLQCHGLPNEQIKTETLDNIAALYPEDKAKGYDVNQLRGIWVVTMDKRE